MLDTECKTVIFVITSVIICFCLTANAQDEVTSGGNQTVIVRWTLADTNPIIKCRTEVNQKSNLTWYLNVDQVLGPLPDVGDKIKLIKEPDGSVSLEFSSVSYDIINAFGAVKDYSVAVYTCVATGTNSPTNHTDVFISVKEYRSAGTVTLAVFLLLGFLAFATFLSWKLNFNYKSIQAVPE